MSVASGNAKSGSYIQGLRSKRQERVKDLHLYLAIPTWDGDLLAKFRVLDRKAMDKFGNKERNTEVDMDFIISAIDSLWVRDPGHQLDVTRMKEDDDYARVEDERGMAVTFTQQLVEWLGIGENEGDPDPETMKARDVVRYLYDNNSIAIGAAVFRLISWMSDTDQKVGTALSGE